MDEKRVNWKVEKDDLNTDIRVNPHQLRTPWGTSLTPIVKTKIVGSNYKMTPEDYQPFKKDPILEDSRHPLSHFRDKNDAFDPTEYKERFRGKVIRSRSLERDEPDSWPQYRTQMSPFNQRQVLPPITYRDSPRNDYHHHHSHRPVSPPMHPPAPVYPNENYSQGRVSPHHEVSLGELYCLLPPHEGLPHDPLNLSREHELALMTNIYRELTHFDPGRLKELYLAMADYDENLSGYIPYPDLLQAAQKHQLFLSPKLLRLVASLFVSTHEHNYVNYEKVLSFIGAAMKMTPMHLGETRSQHNLHYNQHVLNEMEASPRSQDKQIYYHDDHCDEMELNDSLIPIYPTERDDPKLLHILEQQFRNHPPVNFEALRIALQRADSLHRGTLSEQQIKDFCYDHRLPIQESVLEKVIRRCQHRGGGQYDWQQFISYLERVQPLLTGLKITPSKMPSEYVRHYPHPAPSWPHAETHRPQVRPTGTGVVMALAPSPSKLGPEAAPMYREAPPQPPQENGGIPIYQQKNGDIDNHSHSTSSPRKRREEHQTRPVDEIHDYEVSEFSSKPTNYQLSLEAQPKFPQLQAPPQNVIDKMPWFSRYLKMADAIYRHDTECRGHLPVEDIKWLVGEYNRCWQLELSKYDVEESLRVSEKRNGRVDINNLLKRLAIRS